jgi:guanylate kinase
MQRDGILFVVSAPSAAGKSTLIRGLKQTPDFVFSVSCTTRPPRANEQDGREYHFISAEEFQRRADAGEFLEHAQVHAHRYGTPKAATLELLRAGQDVLLDIDIAGARHIRALEDPRIRSSLVDVFIMPPTTQELERRLRQRATESEEQIQLRLANAREEMKAWPEYRYCILSGTPEEDLDRFRSIMKAERLRTSRLNLTQRLAG